MKPLKTYRQISNTNGNAGFGISRMQDIFEKRSGRTDEPHRHEFYTILLLQEGKGQHLIDFKSYALKGNQVFFIGPGQVHQLQENQKSIGFSIVFSEQFLVLHQISSSFIEDINLFHDFGDAPPLQLNAAAMANLTLYCEQIEAQHRSNHTFKFDAIGALLKLILIHCHSVCSINNLDLQTREGGGELLRNFKKLVHENYRSCHQISAYADVLNISPDHLNRVVKTLTGKTSKEHLQSRIVTAAKRLLYFSELSSKEIGYELGFSEPSNFSAFFKKCTGQSPTTFKNNQKIGFS